MQIGIKQLAVVVAGMLVWALPSAGQNEEPFAVSASIGATTAQGYRLLTVDFSVQPNHYLYAERVSIGATGVMLHPMDLPEPKIQHDEIMGEDAGVYDADVTFVYRIEGEPAFPIGLNVSYQGCSKDPMLCFLPASETVSVSPTDARGTTVDAAPSEAEAGDSAWRSLAEGYTLSGRAVGYLDSLAFLEFLGGVERGETVGGNTLGAALQDRGILFVLLAILLGGLALNLTPCVLPMIPINIAIIGAGAQAGSRARGFALGSAYGAGIALVYGALGLVVAVTGAKFGALNASPVFNFAIAALFVVMSLAMFGVIHIDLSRFQKGGGSGRKGSFATAIALGAVAALLAGACVAPVVIAVLLLATDLQARGNAAGLLLPFVLGIGMALPWPFAGAGLSFLPKPGQWMERVKMGFGVLILLFALWYGKLGVQLLTARSDSSRASVAAAQEASVAERGWHTSLVAALEEGKRSGKPVFVDFWATWCKNCLHMEKTTFKDPVVLERLDSYVKLKYQAESISDPEISQVLDYFGAFGLPTYVILNPAQTAAAP